MVSELLGWAMGAMAHPLAPWIRPFFERIG